LIVPDYKILFESVPGQFLVLSPDLYLIAVSDAYAKATLTVREDIMGKHLFQVFPDNPNDPAANGVQNLKASLKKVVQTRELDTMAVQKYDIQKPAEDGGGFEERFWSCMNCPVLNAKGEILYIIHRAEDVTEFVHLRQQESEKSKMTEELKEKNQRMEAEVYSRSQEVQKVNMQLKKLYDELQQRDQLKTKFFSNVSHELRTPLALILGSIERNLVHKNLDESYKNTLDHIQRNARIVLKHVNDLLDIAKLEVGKMSLKYVDLDVSTLTRFAASNFQSLAAERGHQFAVETPKHLRAQIDPDKFQRILTNLLSNAFKFTPPNGFISCRLKEVNSNLELIVSDSGPGISQEDRKNIFQRFFQAEESSIRKFGGTGLGLSIVKEFVDLHDGNVEVAESDQKGALFKITLPLQAPANSKITDTYNITDAQESILETIETFKTPVVKDNSSTGSVDKTRNLILVVEDNPEMRHFIVETLSGDFNVVTAENGKKGLEKLQTLKPDLILTDVMMPEMSGDQMISQIRNDTSFGKIPIILLTAKADDDLRIRLLREGAQDYLMKPFSQEELRSRIWNFVTLKHLMNELESKNKELQGFSHTVAHDLRAPLRSLIGFSHIILEDYGSQLPAEVREYFDRITKSAQRMTALIDGLLSLSRLSRAEMKWESVDLSQLAFAIVSDLKELAPNRKSHFNIANNLEVKGDRQLLASVIQNLLDNAWKYSAKKDFAEISVGVQDQVYFVKDNGAGFDMKYAKKLFETFTRLHSEEEFAGIGIGLATVKRIIDRHGGKIWAESKVGEGTTFYFTLGNTPPKLKLLAEPEGLFNRPDLDGRQ
jgi:signal transduction histidine kinase